MYVLSYVVLCSVLTLSFGRTNSNCTSGSTLAQMMFFTTVEEVRRGVPNDFACDLYAEFLGVLGRFAAKANNSDGPLAEFCFPWRFVQNLIASDGTLYSFKNILKGLEADHRSPSYLSREDYYQIPNLSPALRLGFQSVYGASIVPLLATKPKQKYYIAQHTVPSNGDILYDPKRSEACYQYWRFSSDGGKISNAKDFALNVLGLVIRLRLSGVPDAASYQIMQHAWAFLQNGRRCLSQEGRRLGVPTALWPIYTAHAAMLVKSANLTVAPPVRRSLLETHYEALIVGGTTYRSWGFDEVFQTSDYHISNFRSWKSMVFDEDILEAIKSSMTTSRSHRSSSAEMNKYERAQLGERGTKAFTSRAARSCADGWRFEPSAGWQSSPLEKCCSDLCYDASISGSAVPYSARTCCRYCNQYQCNSFGHHLTDYVTIIPQYGRMAERAISIMI